MNASLIYSMSLGIGLGLFFFMGLWWTVKKGLASRRPELWFLGSLLVRSAVVLGGFYLVGNGDWKKMTACLSGFIVARLIAIRLPRGARHAP